MCELQVLENTAPKYAKLDPRQYHGSVYGKAAAARGYQRAVNEWNYQVVRVQGTTIQVELNGEPAFESKGWEGMNATFGVGFDYQFSSVASVGLDLKFIRPLYSMWIANFEEPYQAPPTSTPDAWVVTPTVRVTVHLWSPES